MKKTIIKILTICLAICVILPSAFACANNNQTETYVYQSNQDGTHRKTDKNGQSTIEDCSGGSATCLNKAICQFCNACYGEIGDHNYVADKCTLCEQDMPISQGLKYTLVNGNEYKVSKGDCIEYNIYIPSTYNGKKVTMIDYAAFSGSNQIKSVTMQENIKYIFDMAFNQCSSLQKVTLPEGLEQIGTYAFKGCAKLNKVVMPDSVIMINSGCFEGCTKLESVVLSKNLTKISNNMFEKCSSLKEVVIPNSVKEIDLQAFSSCIALDKIIIPSSVETMGDYVFNSCKINIKILCEAQSKPSGWSSNWDRNHPVYWYSETAPKNDELCWRYVNGQPTIWNQN